MVDEEQQLRKLRNKLYTSTEIQDERDFQRDLDDMYRMADEFFATADSVTIVREARFSSCRSQGHEWTPAKASQQVCANCGAERLLNPSGGVIKYIYPKGYVRK